MIRNLIIPYRTVMFPVITSTSPLPAGTSGQPYSFQYTATGGVYPYTWSTSGVGAGFSLSSSGLLTGNPVLTGTFTSTTFCTDAYGTTVSGVFSLTIVPANAPQITTTSPLPSAQIGHPYSVTLSATGGSPPYTWAINSDSPNTGNWLSINASTGVLSGTPSTAETEAVKVTVTDSQSVPSAPVTFSLSVSASPYVFDHFVSPTGDDVLGNGSLGNPWSLAALTKPDGTGPGTWHVLGVLPGLYTSYTSNGLTTRIGDFINSAGTSAFILTAGGTAGSPRVVASCDANGNYSPRTAFWDAATTNPFTATRQPIRNGTTVVCGGLSNITFDGIVIQHCSVGGFGAGSGSNVRFLNGDVGNGMAPNESYNANLYSVVTGGDAMYVYNTRIHDGQQLGPQNCTLTNITNFGCTLTAINGASTASTGWPFDSTLSTNVRFSILFTDTSQGLQVIVAATNGSNALTFDLGTVAGTVTTGSNVISGVAAGAFAAQQPGFYPVRAGANVTGTGIPANTTVASVDSVAHTVTMSANATGNAASFNYTQAVISGTPSGAAKIQMGPTQTSGANQMFPLYWPYGQWGFYQEAAGQTTPTLLEHVACQKTFNNGNKTKPGQVSHKRSYFSIYNFNNPGSQVGTAWAFNGVGPYSATSSVSMDHTVYVGNFDMFNAGTVSDGAPPNLNQCVQGTFNETNCTHHSGAASAGAGEIFAISQANPPTINSSSNLYAAATGGWILWAASGGSNFGTVNSNNNAFLLGNNAMFRRTNTPAFLPGSSFNTGTTFTLAQVQASLGYETNSQSLAGVAPFVSAPQDGYPESWALDPNTASGQTARTAGVGGRICGANDGTLGSNGMPWGPNFLSFSFGTAPNFTTFTNSYIPAGKVGQAYSAQVTALGGSGNYTYSLSASPDWLLWLSINTATGALSGTPPMVGADAVTISAVCNITGRTGTVMFEVAVLHQ